MGVLAPLLLVFVLPIVLWLGAYAWLSGRMLQDGIPSPPLAELGTVLFFYIVALYNLPTLALGWSGMHIIGIPCLFAVGGPLLLIIGLRMRKQSSVSHHHRGMAWASLGLATLLGFLVVVMVVATALIGV